MPLARIVKPSQALPRLRAALRILPGPRAAVWPLVVAWAGISLMLAFVPKWWLAAWQDRNLDAWFSETHVQAVRLVQEWEHWTAPVPAFATGAEPPVQAWLAREALVTALVDASNGQVWLREDGRLRRAAAGEGAQAADWARRALETAPPSPPGAQTGPGPFPRRGEPYTGSGVGWLVGTVDPEYRKRCSIVSYYGKWCLIKSWAPGSPAGERWLRGTLGLGAPYRFGIASSKEKAGKPKPLECYLRALKESPALDSPQILSPDRAPARIDKDLSQSFGICYAVVQMAPDTFRRFHRAYVLRWRLAWTSYALMVAASGLAVALVLFNRNREKDMADRLATLTHSLKTPLAVLRLRCETALNTDLPREAQEQSLMEIRSEVDHLVRTIESGLEEARPRYSDRSLDRVDGSFFEALDEELTPAFEARGRLLEVYGSEVSLRCSATVLRAALSTLAENALVHGRGRVVLQVARTKGMVRVSVSDEGEGLPAPVLEGLRHKLQVRQGRKACAGGGMGLLVLARLARQEGWGLAFEKGPEGFSAILEIPA